jgi:hypothetical protein
MLGVTCKTSMLSVVILGVTCKTSMLSVFVLSVFMLSVVMLSVVILSVMAPQFEKCRSSDVVAYD